MVTHNARCTWIKTDDLSRFPPGFTALPTLITSSSNQAKPYPRSTSRWQDGACFSTFLSADPAAPHRNSLQQQLLAWAKSMRPVDILLPISIFLHLQSDRSSIRLALALLLAWMAWRLLQPLLQQRSGLAALRAEALGLGLLLVNARVIIYREDIYGPTNFLLIGLGLLIGSGMDAKAWRATLGWIGIAALLLNLALIQASSSSATQWILDPSLLPQLINSQLSGHGGINRFATLVLMVCLCSWYFGALSQTRICRIFGFTMAALAYGLCIGSGSRASLLAPPISILAAWAALRLRNRSHWMKIVALASTVALGLVIALWWFVLGPDRLRNQGSDLHRLDAASCWFSLMFTGDNRLLLGVGYGSEKANRICHHVPNYAGVEGAIGHAHNTVAQIGGHLGLLGLVALALVLALLVQGLTRQLLAVTRPLPWDFAGSTWAEAALGLNLALAINALATTIFRSNQVNQCLIGLLAASALCRFPLSGQNLPETTSPAANPSPAGG